MLLSVRNQLYDLLIVMVHVLSENAIDMGCSAVDFLIQSAGCDKYYIDLIG